MRLPFIALAASAVTVSASWTKNLNYRSPSEHHPFMGIAIHKVVRRNDLSSPFDPAQLNFTHGVASGDPYPHSVILVSKLSSVWQQRTDY